MTTLRERVRQVAKHEGLCVREFEMRCGLSNGSVSKMGENTRRTTIKAICNEFPEIDEIWLLTGAGEMVANGALAGEMVDGRLVTRPATVEDRHLNRVMYYPNVRASLGLDIHGEPDEHEAVPIYLPANYGADLAVHAEGDSMMPEINNGELVLLRKWEESFIAWGRYYLVCTRTGLISIKKLMKADEPDKVLLVSVNPKYEPNEIDQSEITHLYRVMSWMHCDSM